MRTFLILAGMLCLLQSAFAQNRCGTPPPAGSIVTLPDARVAQQLQQFRSERGGVKTLPVIFHVFHSLGNTEGYAAGANIPHQRLVDALNKANACLRKQNADTSLIPAPFQTLAADCEVELCLAQTDESGNAMYEAGVMRYNCQSYGITPNDFMQINQFWQNYTPQFVWDQTRYLNVWVTPLAPGGYGGYGFYPDSSGLPGLGNSGTSYRPEDGIYIAAAYMNGNSRTLAHEVGHFLGLLHIWGHNTGCDTDYCNDTPTHAGPNSGCPSFPHVTCSNGPNGDMFTNYMDYSIDNCQHQFTYDQKARMQAALANSPRRRELVTSNACAPGPPQAPVAAFANAPSLVCPGQPVQFYENSGYQPASWSWSFPGGTPSTSTQMNPLVTYAAPGTYAATLTVSNSQGSHTVTVPNVVTVLGTGVYPAFADFENGQLPPSDFQLITIPFTWPQPTWAIGNASAYGVGQKSLRMYSWYLHPVRSYFADFTNTNMPVLSFDYAAAEGSVTGSSADSLWVEASTDCGMTFTRVLMIPDSLVRTAPPTPNFVPSASQWKTVTADLSAFAGMPGVYVQISGSFATDWIYIDNINLYPDPLSVNAPAAQNVSLAVLPNPSSGSASLSVSGIGNKTAALTLHDLSGRVLGSVRVRDGQLPLDFGTALPPGIYFLRLDSGDAAPAVVKWIVTDAR